MQLNEQQLEFIREETIKQWPKEAVFAIVGEEVVSLLNTHPEPETRFRVDEFEVVHKLKADALVHSHTIQYDKPRPEFLGEYVDHRVPSKSDMVAQMNLGIPFGINATDGKEYSEILWFPDLDADLIGRTYIANVYDCYEILRSWFWQTHGILIKPNPREYAFWTESPNEVLDKYTNFDFVEVFGDELRIGDVFVLRVIGNYTSHVAIYIGDDQILHHLPNQLSKPDSFPKWRNRIVKKLRHRDLL